MIFKKHPLRSFAEEFPFFLFFTDLVPDVPCLLFCESGSMSRQLEYHMEPSLSSHDVNFLSTDPRLIGCAAMVRRKA